MFHIKAYSTRAYDRTSEHRLNRKDRKSAFDWAREFLKEPGRKVVIYNYEVRYYGKNRTYGKSKPKLVKWWEGTSENPEGLWGFEKRRGWAC